MRALATGRRAFVKLMLGAVGLAAWPARAAVTEAAGRRRELQAAAAGWTAQFGSLESARQVGRAYLHRYPEEGDLALLCDRVGAGLDAARGAQPDWSAVIRDEFARGETVSLNGWLLSRTEVRLCAITVLA